MRRPSRALALPIAAALLVSLAGCGWLFVNREKYEAQALAVFQAGEELYKQERYGEAIDAFTQVIEEYHRSKLVDDAYYLASLSFAKRRDWPHAVGAAQKLCRGFPSSPLIPRVHILLAEGYEHLELYPQATVAYLDAYLYSPSQTERQRAEEQAKNLLGREQDYDVLLGLYSRYKETAVAEWLLYRLGTRAFEVENYDASERYFAELRRRFPKSPYIEKIGGREIAAAALKGKLVCGLLLALSGNFSAYARQVKEGVELAHSLRGSGAIHLETYDTRSDASEARKGAETLIRKGAKIIIGPLTSAEVKAAVDVAAGSGVVMISPTSTNPELLSAYPCLFQLNSYAEEETRAIARYACQQRITSFGILYPQTDQGRLLADVFAAEVRRHGGQVIYSQALTDTVVEMKQTLLGIRHQGAQAVFLPFDRQALLSIVPQIAYYKMKVRILGIDDFADAEILRRGGVPFDGAWFAAPPGRLAGSASFEAFFAHYKRRYGSEPDWAATLGYDAYTFIFDALSEGKNLSLCDALRSLDDRRGILGRLVFSPTAEYPAMKIYTIYQDEVKELE